MKSTPSMFSAIAVAGLLLLGGNHPACGAVTKPATKSSLRSGFIVEEKASSSNENRHLKNVFSNDGKALGLDQGNAQSDPVEESCTLVFTGDFAGESDTNGLRCQTDDGILFQITGTTWTDKVWVDNGRKSGLFKSGETRLIMTGLNKINNGKDKFEIEGPANIHGKIVNPVKGNGPPSRKLATTTGTRTVLMVRAQPTDRSIVQTEAQLSADLFGTSTSQVSMKSQYAACSAGKLNMTMAPNRVGTTYSISNGLVTVPLNITNTPTTSDTAFENAITASLNSNFNVTSPDVLADHVMYCLPNGRLEDTLVSAGYVNHWLTRYKEDWCDRLSANMHELGHNLGLAHSGENDATTGSFYEYGDKTGMMGPSYPVDDGPRMCFNAAKSWQLGWYSDKTMVLDANNNPSFVGNLAGIVDYGTTSDKVLLRIKSTAAVDPIDYYVNFNKATGINDMTQEYSNMVTVVAQGGGGSDYSQSELVAALGSGKSYTEDWGSDSTGLLSRLSITVGNIGSVASVSVKLQDVPCATSSDCPASSCFACNADKKCQYQPLGEPGDFLVNIKTDDYPEDTSWVFTAPDGTVIAQRQRNVYYTAANREYFDTVPLESPTCGIYTFTINDHNHDGICCGAGAGYYNISWNGNLTKSGEQFETSETTTFRVKAVEFPTYAPVKVPTKAPTKKPTKAPTKKPTKAPTKAPTTSVCGNCSVLGQTQCKSCSSCLWSKNICKFR